MSGHTLYYIALLFLSTLLAVENVMRVNENINGTCKILLIKVSVGAIVVQGLVEEFLFAGGVLDVKDTDRYSAEERAQRALST
jgi:membrane protease YdiL (CAAX protease family)